MGADHREFMEGAIRECRMGGVIILYGPGRRPLRSWREGPDPPGGLRSREGSWERHGHGPMGMARPHSRGGMETALELEDHGMRVRVVELPSLRERLAHWPLEIGWRSSRQS